MDQSVLAACRVLPVVTAISVDQTVALSRALLSGGMKAVEITLRTEAALASIAAVKEQVPGLLIAAGTVTNPDDLNAAVAAGADFCVSPGLTDKLLNAASQQGVNFVPGVSTASEVMHGMDYGYTCFKLFPAVAVGGINLLKSLSGPYPNVQFCPTGGLNEDNFRSFLALPNVLCCGGSWMVSGHLVDAHNWPEVERLAREAMTQ